MNAITVSKFNAYVKNIFEAETLLHNIPVVGEVFGVSISRNSMYFSLRDEGASLSCVCFYPALFDQIREGGQVIVTGSPNFYVKGGKFSFVVTKVEEGGQGKLFEQFMLLKEKLSSEGLFDQSHKKPLPAVIKRIGVITSSEGAVIQDIKNVGWRRNPALDIVLFSTRVQGIGAENEIAHAIDVMGRYDNIDCLVVARGGGSLEDLWAYNTEVVARAAYNCPKPLVSAVGHETDFTIIDFVSDLRAPTPSAAAELLTTNVDDKKDCLLALAKNMVKNYQQYLQRRQQNLESDTNQLSNSLQRIILEKEGRFKHLALKLSSGTEKFVQERSFTLGMLENSLAKLNPSALLQRGYAKIEQNGRAIGAASQVDYASDLEIYFKDDKVVATPKNKGETI